MRGRYHRGRNLLVTPRRAGRDQARIKRAVSRLLLINAERKSLLAGTALVSTLLFGTVIAPKTAVAQTIVIPQQETINNNAKSTTGLEAVLTFSGHEENNLDADQSIILTNDIVINNSGDIDPLIAIGAEIHNYTVDFRNYSPLAYADVSQENAVVNTIIVANNGGLIATNAGIVASIRNDDSVLFNDGFALNFDDADFGVRNQSTDIRQTNTLTNAIFIETNADIDAGQDGIAASVENNLLQIQNAAESFNDSFGDGAILTQIAEVEQANVLANLIDIGNAGGIVTNNSGIGAGILNDDVYLYNGCACGIGNINFGTADILSQTAEAGQYNVLGNVIVIENDGGIVTGVAGISATITNRRTELKNDALVLNENYLGADSAEQNAETNQINLAINAIAINNGGDLDPQNGIYVGVLNDRLSLLNLGDPYLGEPPGNIVSDQAAPSFSTEQSSDLLQSNDLINTVAVENRGPIGAGFGIVGRIHNGNVELENSFIVENVSETISIDNLAQSIELLQNNTVSNDIAILNSGGISARRDGIQAGIENEFMFLNQALVINVAYGTIGQLEQSIDVAQVNLVSSNIAIENRGEIASKGIGIVAEIRNRIGFFNIVDANNLALAKPHCHRQPRDDPRRRDRHPGHDRQRQYRVRQRGLHRLLAAWHRQRDPPQ